MQNIFESISFILFFISHLMSVVNLVFVFVVLGTITAKNSVQITEKGFYFSSIAIILLLLSALFDRDIPDGLMGAGVFLDFIVSSSLFLCSSTLLVLRSMRKKNSPVIVIGSRKLHSKATVKKRKTT